VLPSPFVSTGFGIFPTVSAVEIIHRGNIFRLRKHDRRIIVALCFRFRPPTVLSRPLIKLFATNSKTATCRSGHVFDGFPPQVDRIHSPTPPSRKNSLFSGLPKSATKRRNGFTDIRVTYEFVSIRGLKSPSSQLRCTSPPRASSPGRLVTDTPRVYVYYNKRSFSSRIHPCARAPPSPSSYHYPAAVLVL